MADGEGVGAVVPLGATGCVVLLTLTVGEAEGSGSVVGAAELEVEGSVEGAAELDIEGSGSVEGEGTAFPHDGSLGIASQ